MASSLSPVPQPGLLRCPQPLLLSIASYLPLNEVRELSLACRSLRKSLFPRLFRSVRVDGHQLEGLRALRKRPGLGTHVRSLNIDLRICMFKSRSVASQLSKLLYETPYLRRFRLVWDEPLPTRIARALGVLTQLEVFELEIHDTHDMGLGGLQLLSGVTEVVIRWFPRDTVYGVPTPPRANTPSEFDGESSTQQRRRQSRPPALPPPDISQLLQLFHFVRSFSLTLQHLTLGPLPLPPSSSIPSHAPVQRALHDLFSHLPALRSLTHTLDASYTFLPRMPLSAGQLPRLKRFRALDTPHNPHDGLQLYAAPALRDVDVGATLSGLEAARLILDLRDKPIERLVLRIGKTDDELVERIALICPQLKELSLAFAPSDSLAVHLWPQAYISPLSTLLHLERLTLQLPLDLLPPRADPAPLALPSNPRWQTWNTRSLTRYDRASAELAAALGPSFQEVRWARASGWDATPVPRGGFERCWVWVVVRDSAGRGRARGVERRVDEEAEERASA